MEKLWAVLLRMADRGGWLRRQIVSRVPRRLDWCVIVRFRGGKRKRRDKRLMGGELTDNRATG